jgi:DNA mismatch repair ATPase MutS
MSLFTVCPSIAVGDSLSDGKSKFLAEIERLQQTIHAAQQTGPVLFLIDEILSGTNSADRKAIAEALICTLLDSGAVGVVSTHDQLLIDIANIAGFGGANVHMASRNPDDPLDFDFRIKPGPARQSNALAISRTIGICNPPAPPTLPFCNTSRPWHP